MLAALTITGKLPLNEFSATGAGAPTMGSVWQSTTGGSLPAGQTLRVSLCAMDANGLPSVPARIAIVPTSTPGTDNIYAEQYHLAGGGGPRVLGPVRLERK